MDFPTKTLGTYMVLGVYESRTSTGTSWVDMFFNREYMRPKCLDAHSPGCVKFEDDKLSVDMC